MCSYFTLFRTLRQTYRQTSRPTHRRTQPFTPFGAVWRFAAALWRRLTAPAGLPPPLPTPSGVAATLRVAWPLLRLVVEPAGASALRHTCPANFAASAASSPSVVGSISPYFALDFSCHLSVNGKRQSAMVTGMSRQTDKRKEDCVWNQERCKPVPWEATREWVR